MAIDFVAEGLLEGAADEPAREARLELLRTLEGEGSASRSCAKPPGRTAWP